MSSGHILGSWVPYLPGCDRAQDVDDAVGLLLPFLRILLAKQATAAQEKGKPFVSALSPWGLPSFLCFLFS